MEEPVKEPEEVLEGDEKIYKELNKMKLRIIKDESSLKDLKDQDVLILFGTTGSGKSTLANAFINGIDNIEQTDGLYNVLQDLEYKGEKIFQIGHRVKSETMAPKYHPFS